MFTGNTLGVSVTTVRDGFRSRFGTDPEIVSVAPGRINLIGEHTDYNDGFVFPAAIDREIYVAASVAEDASVLCSGQAGEGQPFDVGTVEPGMIKGWSTYPAAMAWSLRKNGHRAPNLKAYVTSNLPMGSGVSSSAALELAFGVIYRALGGLDLSGEELAWTGKACENQFVGVNSGIMDQFACALGRKDLALFLDTRSMEVDYASIPPSLSIVLCDTKKERALAGSAYNERRAQCEEACRILGIKALRDADLFLLEQRKSEMPEVVYRRAKHVISENDRAQAFKVALNDSNLAALGRLMAQSHISLRDDYEVSCRELDQMAEAAWESEGCVGARMTGAGFGGACVTLVETSSLGRFTAGLLEKYDAASGLKGEAIACKAVDGAHIV
jgi:galactokinase